MYYLQDIIANSGLDFVYAIRPDTVERTELGDLGSVICLTCENKVGTYQTFLTPAKSCFAICIVDL